MTAKPPREMSEYETLKKAVLDYLSECDNPAPDYTMRRLLRDHLRKLTGAPSARLG